MPARFDLGQVVATPGALASIPPVDVLMAIRRHQTGDWGDMDKEDLEANDWALANGGRLFSSYRSSNGRKYWIITEHDRSVTTILLPEEY